ncbi:hypothetical protein [Methylobacterium sp. Leaf466]|uniref:hypothetical protein n=1 Tax=Methylobacterium sp. Leaf466 TaxID=1736386 RepID=UPI0006FE95FF|nr:hypothetical protein [Methylobacterium sp. Leaf466]KQT77384.1 hypothetical protein ASG59_12425 [Methylobacterium sp. Leaf466]
MSLSEYQALDLSADGPVAADLSARIAEEAACPTVPLSSSHGAAADSPALLTPAMEIWYRTRVASARVSAIAEIRRGFEQETLGGNPGFLYEAERDRIEQVKQGHLRAERDGFFQSKRIRDRETEIDRLRSEYAYKRSQHGRDAGAWNPVFKHGGVAAIMLLEFPLNLSSFLRIDFLTPALATASVLLIAILFAFSSHLLGRILRQWGERFGDNVTRRLRADSYRHLAVAAVLFLIGAAAIVFSRSYLVAEALNRQAALGEEGGSTVAIYGIAFIGNLAVYAVAVAWVLFTEDPVPDFAEERARLDLLKAQSQAAYRKGLERQQQQRIEQARRDREQLDRREADQAKGLRNYAACRARFDVVARQDARVLGLLESYRNRLVAEARKRGVQTRFTHDDLASGDIGTRRDLEADDYLGRRLGLGHA